MVYDGTTMLAKASVKMSFSLPSVGKARYV